MKRLILLLMLSHLVWGCGAPPKKVDPRERLRKNADEASDINYQKPMGRVATKQARPSRTTSAAGQSSTGQCVDQPSCFPSHLFFLAQGQGEDLRAAELDAQARLSAKIRSEVSSTVTQTLSEGSQQDSSSQGTIVSQVKTSFSHGELIQIYQMEGEEPIQVLAVLEKAKYKKVIEEELEPQLTDLARKLDTIDANSSLQELSLPWSMVLELDEGLQSSLAEYRAVLGTLPTTYQTLSQKMKMFRRIIATKVSKVSFILEFEGDEQGELAMKGLIKQGFQTLKLKVKSAGTCLKGHYLVKVNYEFADKVHPVTGGQSLSLAWQASLLACQNNGEQTEVTAVTFPQVKGTERYQASALTQVEKYLKEAKKELHNGTYAQGSKKDRLSQQVLNSLKTLVEQVIPVHL